MKVAITGANGFVGRELIQMFQHDGVEVFPIVRRESGLPNEIVSGNLEATDIERLSYRLEGINAVVHLAARTHVMKTETDALEKYTRTNVEGTRRLLAAVTNSAVERFVFMSSIKVNGERTYPGQIFSGNDDPRPEDDYGNTKRVAEDIIRDIAVRTGLRTAILRPPMVYGLGVGGNFARLVTAVRRGLPLPFGMIDNRRSLISVRNLCEATVKATTISNLGNLVLTLSDGKDVSTRHLVRSIGMAVSRPARLVPVPSSLLYALGLFSGRQNEVRRIIGNLQVDTMTAQHALGWIPSETLDTGLQRIFRQSM